MAIADGADTELFQAVSDAYGEFLKSRNLGTTGERWEMSRAWWDRCAATIPRDEDDPPPEPSDEDRLYGMPITVVDDGPPRVVAEQRPYFTMDEFGQLIHHG